MAVKNNPIEDIVIVMVFVVTTLRWGVQTKSEDVLERQKVEDRLPPAYWMPMAYGMPHTSYMEEKKKKHDYIRLD